MVATPDGPALLRDRIELGLTKADLAKLSGISTRTIYHAETGKKPVSAMTWHRLNRALNAARAQQEAEAASLGASPAVVPDPDNPTRRCKCIGSSSSPSQA